MPLPAPLSRTEPFVLLDDARADGEGARLYRRPQAILVARRAQEVAAAFEQMAECAGRGLHLAGYVAYEAGLALEPRLAPLAEKRTGADGPLVWMGAFEGFTALADPAPWLAAHSGPGPHRLGPLTPRLGPGDYAARFAQIIGAIEAGDIYQANFTFPLEGRWAGDPLALYAGLRGGAAHGGVVHTGQDWLLSLSPELFVALDGSIIRAKPMKGTRPRGATPAQDAALAQELAACEKDRAENLMILDLMRNDIARVAVPGSVRADHPFAIETYPSVHQMVSGVRAELAPGLGAVDLLRALFPCGSVTGAPKIRAMEWINATETTPRGAYCGAIGRIDPPAAPKATGGAAFNVAIRTLRLTPDQRAVLGVGSAVVADSGAMAEWRECLVKGGFVHQPAPGKNIAQFDLIETMGFAPDTGIALLELHLERLKASAAELGFEFDRHAARNAIHALCFELEAPAKLRLMLARSGAIALEVAPRPAPMAGPVACAVLPLPVDERDWRLAHKTSDRWFYTAALRAARGVGAGEALFVRDDGRMTEGSFTNVFVEREGVLLTPPAALGLLPGVLRRSLLEAGRAREADLTLADLEGGFFIGNALRGLMPARLLG